MRKLNHSIYKNIVLMMLIGLGTIRVHATEFSSVLNAIPIVYQENLLLTAIGPAQTRSSLTWSIKNGATEVGTFAIINPKASNYTNTYHYTIIFIPKIGGRYTFGLMFNGKNLRLLAPGVPLAPSDATRVRYPYDWDIRWSPNVTSPHFSKELADVESISPGVLLDSRLIAHDSYSLYEIKLAQKTSDLSWNVFFFKQREFNDGRDRVSRVIALEANQSSNFKIVVTDSVKKAQLTKVTIPNRSIVGMATQIPFQGWGGSLIGQYLSDSDFNYMAQTYGNKNVNIKNVILRLNEPKAHIAQIFKNHGLSPHYYIFLGASRYRQVSPTQKCYTLIFNTLTLPNIECVANLMTQITNSTVYPMTTEQFAINPNNYHTPGNVAWGFLNLRDPSHRKILVDQAEVAMLNGYQGIFLDGPQLWIARDGYVGGSDTSAKISWYHARALLLQEIKERADYLSRTVASIRSRPYIGLVGNQYTDFQAQADYMVKEVVNWVPYSVTRPGDSKPTEYAFHPHPSKRKVNALESYVQPLKMDYMFYVPEFYLAAKGGGSNIENDKVWNIRNWSQETPSKAYIEMGDFSMTYSSTENFARIYASEIAGVAKHLNTKPLKPRTSP